MEKNAYEKLKEGRIEWNGETKDIHFDFSYEDPSPLVGLPSYKHLKWEISSLHIAREIYRDLGVILAELDKET